MEVYEGAELQLRSFLPSALEGDESTHHAAVALHPPTTRNNSGYALNSVLSDTGWAPVSLRTLSEADTNLLFHNLRGV